MTQEITVVRRTPQEERDATLAPLARQRDVLATLGPRIIRDHSTRMGDRVYIHVAGATLVAAVFGYTVREVEVRRIDIDGVGAWEATCEVVRDGVAVGRGSAICADDEKLWSGRPQFARRAMASTRAAGRALRLTFGHMLPMLGDRVATVTREEMPDDCE